MCFPVSVIAQTSVFAADFIPAYSSKMPFIDLQSNLAASAFSEEFLKKLCSCTAAALGKPEDVSYISTWF